MAWLYVMAAVILGVVVVLLTGHWKGAQAPREESPAVGPDRIDELLSQAAGRSLSAEDLLQVRFDPAVRGYRMEQVDTLIDALVRQLSGSGTAGRSLSAEDLLQVRFDPAVRGYRMEQVDKLFDALSLQLSSRSG